MLLSCYLFWGINMNVNENCIWTENFYVFKIFQNELKLWFVDWATGSGHVDRL